MEMRLPRKGNHFYTEGMQKQCCQGHNFGFPASVPSPATN